MKGLMLVGCSLLALSCPTYAWFGSDFDESAYSCRDINALVMDGRRATADDIIHEAYSYFDSIYTADDAIGNYYLTYVRTRDVLNSYHYKNDVDAKIQHTCSLKSSDDINTVLDAAVRASYTEILSNPRWSFCRALNDGNLDQNAVVRNYAENNGYPASLGVYYAEALMGVLNAPDYGATYVENRLAEYCETHDNEKIHTAMSKATKVAREEMAETVKRAAEAKRKAEDQARHDANVLAYSGSVFSDHADSCYEFAKQRELSISTHEDTAPFKAGVRLSLQDAAQALKPHKKEVFDAMFQSDLDILAGQVASQCFAGRSRKITLAESVASVERIAQAQTSAAAHLSALVEEKSAHINGCGRDRDCVQNIEYQAAYDALHAYHKCDSGEPGTAEGVLCFAEPQMFYEHALALHQVQVKERLYRTHKTEVDKGVSRNDLRYEMEPCKQEAIAKKLRGDQYQDYVQNVCTKRATETLMGPLQAVLKASEQALDQAKVNLATAQSKALSR